MEKIRQAVERARHFTPPDDPQLAPVDTALATGGYLGSRVAHRVALERETTLNSTHLEANRIIAHDVADPRSKAFEILRTEILQTADTKAWQLIGVTSPKPGCGKTVTAINLALSIARLPGRSVLLTDFDLQRPRVADYLGLKVDSGLLSILEGRAKVADTIVEAKIRNERISVLPCESPIERSSEWMASRTMSAILGELRKRDFKGWTVILDLPPILTSDDVITILPQIDCVLFVAGAGQSTVSDIRECTKHLETTPVVRVVLNKAPESAASYYSRYAYPQRDPRS